MRTLTRLVLAAVALGVLAGAQGQDRPEVQLKAAVYKETVEADLQGAIALYKQIVSNGAAARPVAAAALLGLGGCYEKLGQRDARSGVRAAGGRVPRPGAGGDPGARQACRDVPSRPGVLPGAAVPQSRDDRAGVRGRAAFA